MSLSAGTPPSRRPARYTGLPIPTTCWGFVESKSRRFFAYWGVTVETAAVNPTSPAAVEPIGERTLPWTCSSTSATRGERDRNGNASSPVTSAVVRP